MRQRRTLLAVTAGAVALAGALTAALLWPGGEASAVQDDGPHKLVAPKTVLKKYHRWPDLSRGHSVAQDHHNGLGVTDGTAVRFRYSTVDASSGYTPMPDEPIEDLDLDGTYGTVADPEKAVDALFAVLRAKDAHDGTTKLVGKPKERYPEGFTNGVMKCQVERNPSLTGEHTGDRPICVWADYSTVASVSLSVYRRTRPWRTQRGSPPSCAARSGCP